MHRSRPFFTLLATVAFWATTSLLACPEARCAETPVEAEVSVVRESSEPELRVFGGFFAGVGFSSQNVIGGSLIGGRDVLARDHRNVADFLLGWRKQFANRLVVGLEAQVGFVDGDLTQTDAATGYEIEYENDSQVAFGLTLGRVLGSRQRWLVYAYAYETEREFDVVIRSGGLSFTQNDEQGILRLGLGAELSFASPFRLRLSAGTTRADFGGAITNIDADGRLEVGSGVVFSF